MLIKSLLSFRLQTVPMFPRTTLHISIILSVIVLIASYKTCSFRNEMFFHFLDFYINFFDFVQASFPTTQSTPSPPFRFSLFSSHIYLLCLQSGRTRIKTDTFFCCSLKNFQNQNHSIQRCTYFVVREK